MYAVIFEQKLLYLGYSQSKALDVFRSKNCAEIHLLETTTDLKNLIKFDNLDSLESENSADVSEDVQNLFSKLDKIQDIDQPALVKKNKSFAEVRYLGTKNMKTVGEGFVSVVEETEG